MKMLRPTLTIFLCLSFITGFVYPIATTFIGQLFFPSTTAGSLIPQGEHFAGSELIGQPFHSPRYFWGRLSATSPMPYNGIASSGSNFSSTNPALIEAAESRLKALHQADSENRQPVPIDLITASASGLDPHISPEAAYYQAGRVAKERKMDVEKVRTLIASIIEERQWGMLGEPRVNVLKLNRALDGLRS